MFSNPFNTTTVQSVQEAPSFWQRWVSPALQAVGTAGGYLARGFVKAGQFTAKYFSKMNYLNAIVNKVKHRHFAVDIDSLDQELLKENPSKTALTHNAALLNFAKSMMSKPIFLNQLSPMEKHTIEKVFVKIRNKPLYRVNRLSPLELMVLIKLYDQWDSEVVQHNLNNGTLLYHYSEFRVELAKQFMKGSSVANFAPSLYQLGYGAYVGATYAFNGQPIHGQETFLNYSKQAMFYLGPLMAWTMMLGAPGMVGSMALYMLSNSKWYNKYFDVKKIFAREKFHLIDHYMTETAQGNLAQTAPMVNKLKKAYGVEISDFNLIALIEDLPLMTIINRRRLAYLTGLTACQNDSSKREAYFEKLKKEFNINFQKPCTVDVALENLQKTGDLEAYKLLHELKSQFCGGFNYDIFSELTMPSTPAVLNQFGAGNKDSQLLEESIGLAPLGIKV